MNADRIINVVDVVQVVNYILDGGTLSSTTESGAEEAKILMREDCLIYLSTAQFCVWRILPSHLSLFTLMRDVFIRGIPSKNTPPFTQI